MIRLFKQDGSLSPDSPVSLKAANLAAIFSFAINYAITAEHKSINDFQPSIITVIGKEGEQIHVVQKYLKPTQIGEGIEYREVQPERVAPCSQSFDVSSSFNCSLAGIPDVASRILTGQDEDSKKQAVVRKYLARSSDKHEGHLSKDELLELAEYLKKRTSEAHRNEVGGKSQIAQNTKEGFEISDSSGDLSTDQRFNGQLSQRLNFYSSIDHVPIGDSNTREIWLGGVRSARNQGILIQNSEIIRVIQPLDFNAMFVNSRFRDCVLTYSGSPGTIFDSSNKIENCILLVQNQVPKDSVFLETFASNFPKVKIEFIDSVPFPMTYYADMATPTHTSRSKLSPM